MGLLDAEQRRVYERIPEKIDYVDNEAFDAPEAEEKFFGPGAAVYVAAWTHFPEVPDDNVVAKSRRRALSREDEARLFLRYNYARRRLRGLTGPQKRRPTARRAVEMVQWFTGVMKCRADLVRANLALVLAMARRTRIPNVEFGEIVSEGNMALLRSIEKFDVSRGFKFSTYGCRAILKSFNRLASKTGRYRERFPVEFDPSMEQSDYDEKKHQMQRDDSVEALREILDQNRADLSDVERRIVQERFALGGRSKRRTLAEVGKLVGLTNERVRQLQISALAKIRTALNEEYLAA